MEESMTMLQAIERQFDCKAADLRTYSPLALAFLGDAVYSLIIRTIVVERANQAVDKLNRKTAQFVKAPAQAAVADALLADVLTEEEQAVYRRGRNAQIHSSAKNASLSDYRKATGLEALCGYLYLAGDTERIMYLIREGLARSGMEV